MLIYTCPGFHIPFPGQAERF